MLKAELKISEQNYISSEISLY